MTSDEPAQSCHESQGWCGGAQSGDESQSSTGPGAARKTIITNGPRASRKTKVHTAQIGHGNHRSRGPRTSRKSKVHTAPTRGQEPLHTVNGPKARTKRPDDRTAQKHNVTHGFCGPQRSYAKPTVKRGLHGSAGKPLAQRGPPNAPTQKPRHTRGPC